MHGILGTPVTISEVPNTFLRNPKDDWSQVEIVCPSRSSGEPMSKLIIIVLVMLGLCQLVVSMDPQEDVNQEEAIFKTGVMKEAALIKAERRVYDLHYAMYISGDTGMLRFMADHSPGLCTANRARAKQLTVMFMMWYNVIFCILVNVYKFHDLHYSEAPLAPRCRLELLRRMNWLSPSTKRLQDEYGVHFALENAAIEDDGLGFVRADYNDPYKKLSAAIEEVQTVLKAEAEKLIFHVRLGNPSVAHLQVQQALRDSKLPPDLQEKIEKHARLWSKAWLDEIFQKLKDEFGSLPACDTSLAYELLKSDYDYLLIYGETYVKLRKAAAGLDLSAGYDVELFISNIEKFIFEMDLFTYGGRPIGDKVQGRGREVYAAINRGAVSGYVVISDDLLTENPLEPMPELHRRIIKSIDDCDHRPVGSTSGNSGRSDSRGARDVATCSKCLIL
ncbi:hypothetical protein SeLEV6574_g01818 [Synchytrium endobioticum]|uniref:Uncharacterized protein n=1 Tax=Synchytrium endobioticum TaxID=286115 RepID=A0A507DBT9_9FUNG|nr:hypothetical protein SeLEV6574_g01818 [Synchytrium endobioticum]